LDMDLAVPKGPVCRLGVSAGGEREKIDDPFSPVPKIEASSLTLVAGGDVMGA
jgi:hypothetical protein